MKNEMASVINALEKKVGSLSLVLIARSGGVYFSTKTLIVSGVSLDKISEIEATKTIIHCIKTEASLELQKSIGRVNVLSTADPLVHAITSAFDIAGSVINIQGLSFNGLFVPDATVYKSKRPVEKKRKA